MALRSNREETTMKRSGTRVALLIGGIQHAIERSRAALKRAMELTANVDDMDLQAGLLYLQWSIEFMSGDQGAALMAAQQLATVTPRGSDAMRFVGDRILGASLLCAGKLTDAQDHLQRVVDFYAAPSDGHHSLLDIAEKWDIPMPALLSLAEEFARHGLIKKVPSEMP